MIRPIHAATIVVASTAGAATAHADLTINFFGDIDYKVDHVVSREPAGTAAELPTPGDYNTFQAATLDIFASQTEGKFTFVGETVMEAFGTNEFVVDVDRLEVSYQAKPWLRLRAGRMRSAWGYYSDAHQNGKFFMVPVSWPEMYEGDGYDGIVPSHVIGIHADVSKQLGDSSGKLTLDAEVLNGRGLDVDEVPAFRDANQSKALNLRLRYVGQEDLEGFVVGGNVYIDSIPEDTKIEDEHPAMHELALGAHAAYIGHDIHAVAEAAWFRHREYATGTVHTVLATVAELGYTFGDVTPYARYEGFDFSDNGNPYLDDVGIPTVDRNIVSLGAKYIASASVSLKLQGGVAVDPANTHYLAIAQAAFAF